MAAGRKLIGTSSSSTPHDIKKASYYVWFLGAKESKGLRGEEYITPVVRYLINKEKEQAPIKVTLQLSNKGLKIIQNVSGKRVHENYRENVKHFIPHHAITCTVRAEDIVSCILLIYNPATACPVHVHSYRCDSSETAILLHEQLQVLVDRPDNQKKFLEIESRLAEKGLLQRNTSSAGSSKLGSDGRSLGRGSDSGAGSDKGSQLNPSEKIATMYDSLAAELREKLGGKQPLLLPPRDYDTVHRSKGNILGIEERKSLNPKVVGAGGQGVASGGINGGQGRSERGDSSGKSSGIGSDEGHSPVHDSRDFLPDDLDDQSSSDDDWPDESRHPHVNPDSLMLIQGGSSWPQEELGNSAQQALSSRFFQPRSRSGSSPPVKVEGRKLGRDGERSRSPETSASPRDRFTGAKQLFMSLERKKDKERKESTSPSKDNCSPQRNAQKIQPEKLLKKDLSEVDSTQWSGAGEPRHSAALEERQMEGQARWSRYEQEQVRPEDKWPKSDKDTGYVSRYSRDKSRSRDFEESPPSARPNMFVKSGKKTSTENKEKFQNKRLPRFLSRETLESDGYDHIEEFEETEKQRVKVKRQPSKTSLKLDFRRNASHDSGRGEDSTPPDPPPGPRRGFLRREVTELDLKGYMQSKGQSEGFSKKYTPSRPVPPMATTQQALWALPGMPRERALSPVRNRFVGEERYPATRVLSPEFKKESKSGIRGVLGGGTQAQPDNRYPSLDLRTDKRKSLFEGAGEVMRRNNYPEPNTDYRRRSYHELSDIDKLDHAAPRNFQHSGRKVSAEPIGLLPSRVSRGDHGKGYKQLPDKQRYPGLDRENARQHTALMQSGPNPSPAFKNTMYHPNSGGPAGPRGPRSFDHPSSRPAMFRHSYAEPNGNPSGFARISPGPSGGRFGLKPF